MTLAAKGSRSVTVDDIRYRWRMGCGPGPLSFAADLPGQAGSVLVVTISDCPRTEWCDDGEGLAVQSSELPESVKTVARHFDWCCGPRVMALLRTEKPAAPGTWSQTRSFRRGHLAYRPP
jgi:hypothetical protein